MGDHQQQQQQRQQPQQPQCIEESNKSFHVNQITRTNSLTYSNSSNKNNNKTKVEIHLIAMREINNNYLKCVYIVFILLYSVYLFCLLHVEIDIYIFVLYSICRTKQYKPTSAATAVAAAVLPK